MIDGAAVRRSAAPGWVSAIAAVLAGRWVVILLVLLTVTGGALRGQAAANPDVAYESDDERSYAKLALSLSHGAYTQRSDGTSDDLRWAPGAPALFGVAAKLHPPDSPQSRPSAIPAAYWAQALVSTAMIVAVFGLGMLLAGPIAGLVAAGLTAFYPPFISINRALVSETLGAAAIAGAALLLVLALRRRSWRIGALAGGAFGLVVLTRSDFLLALPLLALMVAVSMREAGPGRAAGHAVAFLAAAVLVIAPWSTYASVREDRLVPVTTGGGSALFVGTYLPGDGTTVGLKAALAPRLRARYPAYRNDEARDIPAELALDLVAARHPGLSRDAALTLEGRRNLVRYGLGDPVAFASMMGAKVWRMWGKYSRGGVAAQVRHLSVGIMHWALLALGVAGLAAAALARRLDRGLLVVFGLAGYSTFLHSVFVSQARYNLPVMALVIVGGVAGVAVALARLRDDRARVV